MTSFIASDARGAGDVPSRRWSSVGFVISPVLVWGVIGIVGALALHGSHLFLAATAVTYALFALGTNVLLGWSGMTSFGQAAFFGIGAYSTGLLAPHVASPLVLLLIGAAAGTVVAFAFGLVATRVTGVEFAMLTLVFGQVLWLLLNRVHRLGGESGLPGIPRGEILGRSLFLDSAFWGYAVVVALVTTVLVLRLRESTWGVALTAVRDDPRRAAASGINVRWMRTTAFALAGLVAGLSGALYAQLQGIASPGVISWTMSGEVIIMCLLGGLHVFWGPVLGAVVFTWGNWALTNATSAWQLWLGLVLLIVVLVMPQGLAGLASPIGSWLGRAARTRGKEAS